MRGALERLLARAAEILDGLVEVIAVTIVMRQLAQMIVQLFGKDRFQDLAGEFMQLFAALYQQRIVGDLLRQRVLEDVLGVGQRLLIDELRSAQLGHHPIEVNVLGGGHPPDQGQRRFAPDHRHSL